MKNKVEVIASKRGYVVSEEGIMYNPKGERVGTCTSSAGREKTCIRVDKKLIDLYTHRLQAFQKYKNKLYEKGILVQHLNGDYLNNSWENILIGTNSDNQMDIPEQIRVKRALHATSFARKYNKEEVKKFHKESKSYKKTMEKFNISSKGTLNYILNN